MNVITYNKIKVEKEKRGEGVVEGNRPFASFFSRVGVELVSTPILNAGEDKLRSCAMSLYSLGLRVFLKPQLFPKPALSIK